MCYLNGMHPNALFFSFSKCPSFIHTKSSCAEDNNIISLHIKVLKSAASSPRCVIRLWHSRGTCLHSKMFARAFFFLKKKKILTSSLFTVKLAYISIIAISFKLWKNIYIKKAFLVLSSHVAIAFNSLFSAFNSVIEILIFYFFFPKILFFTNKKVTSTWQHHVHHLFCLCVPAHCMSQ